MPDEHRSDAQSDSMFLAPSAPDTSAAPSPAAATPSPSPVPAASGAPSSAASASTAAPAALATQAQVDVAIQAAQEMGLDVSQFQTGAELVRAMWGAAQNTQRQLQEAQSFLARAQGTQQQPATPQPPAPEQDEWDEDKHWQTSWPTQWKPEYDRIVQAGLVVQGANGMFEPAANAPYMAAQVAEMNQALLTQRNVYQEFQQNPLRFTYQKLQEPLKRMMDARVKEMLDERFGTFNQDRELQELDAALAPHLYVQQAGRYAIDPQTGERAVTPWGQQLLGTIEAIKPNWSGSHAALVDLAVQMLGGYPQAQQAAQQQQPAATPQATPQANPQAAPRPDGFFQDPSGRWHRPGGAFASAEEVSNLTKTAFLDEATRRAMHSPQVATSEAAAAARTTGSDAELNNYFLAPVNQR